MWQLILDPQIVLRQADARCASDLARAVELSIGRTCSDGHSISRSRFVPFCLGPLFEMVEVYLVSNQDDSG